MNQALVTIMFTKAVALLVVSSKVAGWYQAVGARSVMNTCAGINIGISALTIPAYIFGKRFRSSVSVPMTVSTCLSKMLNSAQIARSKIAARYMESK